MNRRTRRGFVAVVALAAACSSPGMSDDGFISLGRDVGLDGGAAGRVPTGGAIPTGGVGGVGVTGGTAFVGMGGTLIPEDGTGGDGGTSTGGKGGTSTGGKGGTSTGADGGTGEEGGTGVNGGTNTNGQGGTAGANGGTCPPCTPTTCTTTILPTQVINDFDNLYFPEGNEQPFGLFGVFDSAGMLKPEWWLGYFSGSYVYPMIPEACRGEPTPAYPLARNEMGGVLRVTGTVGGPSGFGVWVGPCIVDMSAGSGIRFVLGGRAGSGALEMTIGTSSTTDPDACQIGRGKCATNICAPPSVGLDITESPAPIALPWAVFSDGSPSPEVDPGEVVLLRWDFEWVDGMEPYAVDLTLDDVMLIQ